MATIRITDLRLKTIIGSNAWERRRKQPVVINIAFDYDAGAAIASDDLKDAVDYKALKKRIKAFVEPAQCILIEKLAAEVLKIVMAEPRVQKARVRIDKPGALRFSRSVSVRLEEQRGRGVR